MYSATNNIYYDIDNDKTYIKIINIEINNLKKLKK